MARLEDRPLDIPPPVATSPVARWLDSRMDLPPARPWIRWQTVLLAVIFGFCALMILLTSLPEDERLGDRTEAIDHARRIGLAMFEFEAEYGDFPDATTLPKVSSVTIPGVTGEARSWTYGTATSNGYFRQLFASGISSSERVYYCSTRGCKPGDELATPTGMLGKGECGFTYLMGGRTTDRPSRPLVCAPMIPDTDRFDPEAFGGKAVFLWMDNSVSTVPIDKNGHALVDGKNVMDPNHPVWQGRPPIITWPDL